jgi:hypothetical protein
MLSSFEHDETFALPTSWHMHDWDPVELVGSDEDGISERMSMTTATKTLEQ